VAEASGSACSGSTVDGDPCIRRGRDEVLEALRLRAGKMSGAPASPPEIFRRGPSQRSLARRTQRSGEQHQCDDAEPARIASASETADERNIRCHGASLRRRDHVAGVAHLRSRGRSNSASIFWRSLLMCTSTTLVCDRMIIPRFPGAWCGSPPDRMAHQILEQLELPRLPARSGGRPRSLCRHRIHVEVATVSASRD